MDLPDIQKDRPLYDFLGAIKTLDPEFSSAYMIQIERKAFKNKPLPTIHDLIEQFRNHRRLTDASSKADPAAFPATLHGKPEPTSTPNPCLCGAIHWYKECLYLIDFLRPEGWKPDPKIQEQVDEKLNKSDGLKTAVRHARYQARQDKKSQQNQQTTSSNDSQPTQSSQPHEQQDFTPKVGSFAAIKAIPGF